MARKSSIGVLGSSSRPSSKSLVLRDGYQLDQDEESVIVHLQESNTRYLLHNQALVKERSALQKRLAEMDSKGKDQSRLISELKQQVSDLKGQLRDSHQSSLEMIQRFESMMRVQTSEVEQMKQRARLRASSSSSSSSSKSTKPPSKSPFIKPPKPAPARAPLLLTSPVQHEHHRSQESSPMAMSPTHGKRSGAVPASLARLSLQPEPSPVRFGSDAVISMEVSSHFSASTPKRQSTPPSQALEMGSPQQRHRSSQSGTSASFSGSRQILQSLSNSMAPPEPSAAAMPAPIKSADSTNTNTHTDTKPQAHDDANKSITTTGDRRPQRRRTKPVNYAPLPLSAKLRRSSSSRFVDAVGENAFQYVISTPGATTTVKRSGSAAPEDSHQASTTSKSIKPRERDCLSPTTTGDAHHGAEDKAKQELDTMAKTAPASLDCERVDPDAEPSPERTNDDPEWSPGDAVAAKRKSRRPNKRPALANVTNTAQSAAPTPRAKRTRIARTEPDPFAFEE